MQFSILVIDDERGQLESLRGFLSRRGYEVYTAESGKEGVDIARNHTIDLVLTDFRMPGWDGLTVLRTMKENNPEIDVVVMTAYGTIQDAVEIMKAGGYDYLNKPVDLDELENLINRVLEKRRLMTENRLLRDQLQERFSFESIVSQSKEMEEVLNTASRVASSKATVLIRGESGTGKELIARAIHFAGPRAQKPFVTTNIAALPDTLLESELFGHEKGAYTGAAQKRIGRFENAHDGTLFIDEVGDIPLSVQAKLLRAVQFGTIERLGGTSPVEVDVRIIAATHRDLEEMIRKKEFREDLYYRLNVVMIWIPPLRKRRSDIPILIDHFIRNYSEENKKTVRGVTREAYDLLMKYDYPGNIRELENMIERAVVLCRDEYVSIHDIAIPVQAETGGGVYDPSRIEEGYEKKKQAFERAMILEALERSNGNKSAAARLLGITERHLRSRLEKLGLKVSLRNGG
jgi:DNA-binding NtrC family response regulator